MKLKKTKEVKTVYRTETYELTKGVNLIVEYKDGVVTSQRIPHRVKVDNTLKYYDYVADIVDFKNKARQHRFYDLNKGGNYWFGEYLITDYLGEFQKSGFKPENLIIVKYYNHTILDSKGIPLDIMCHSEYIGGFRQKNPESDYDTDWDWEALKKHLSRHSDIYNFEVEEIPYYNSDFYGQEGLKFDYVFKSEWHDKMKHNNAWRALILGNDDFDPLDVNQFKK